MEKKEFIDDLSDDDLLDELDRQQKELFIKKIENDINHAYSHLIAVRKKENAMNMHSLMKYNVDRIKNESKSKILFNLLVNERTRKEEKKDEVMEEFNKDMQNIMNKFHD